MITEDFAKPFAAAWVDSWNSHDLEKILEHYSEDFTIETPMAVKFFPESEGLVKGKSDVRKYWLIGLERIPDLKFEIIDVLTGVECMTIYYVNTATNKRSVEMMYFNADGKVYKAVVNYSE